MFQHVLWFTSKSICRVRLTSIFMCRPWSWKLVDICEWRNSFVNIFIIGFYYLKKKRPGNRRANKATGAWWRPYSLINVSLHQLWNRGRILQNWAWPGQSMKESVLQGRGFDAGGIHVGTLEILGCCPVCGMYSEHLLLRSDIFPTELQFWT